MCWSPTPHPLFRYLAREMLATIGVAVAWFLGCLLFESAAKYRIMLAAIRYEPTGRIRPSVRHIALLIVAAFLAFRSRHLQTPTWAVTVFAVAVVVWLAMLLWDVGREMSRQRIELEKRG